jgi:hypothetical protein
MSKNTRQKGGIEEEKKTPDVRRSPKRRRCKKKNTPKQAPYENKTPHRAASRFYGSQEW